MKTPGVSVYVFSASVVRWEPETGDPRKLQGLLACHMQLKANNKEGLPRARREDLRHWSPGAQASAYTHTCIYIIHTFTHGFGTHINTKALRIMSLFQGISALFKDVEEAGVKPCSKKGNIHWEVRLINQLYIKHWIRI